MSPTKTNEELTKKAINIKGKNYVLVSDRVLAFNEFYPNGMIQTEMISSSADELVVFKATVTPDAEKPMRIFTGFSQTRWGDGMVNKTAAIENAETSSVGRALAMMGIGVIDSIASVDEIKKTTVTKSYEQGQNSSYNTPRTEQKPIEVQDIKPENYVLRKGTSSKTGKPWVAYVDREKNHYFPNSDGIFEKIVAAKRSAEAGQNIAVDPDSVPI